MLETKIIGDSGENRNQDHATSMPEIKQARDSVSNRLLFFLTDSEFQRLLREQEVVKIVAMPSTEPLPSRNAVALNPDAFFRLYQGCTKESTVKIVLYLANDEVRIVEFEGSEINAMNDEASTNQFHQKIVNSL